MNCKNFGAAVRVVLRKVKPYLSNKKVLISIGAVAALLLIVGIISSIAVSGNGYIKLKQTTAVIPIKNHLGIVVDSKLLKDTIKSDYADSTVYNLDGTVTAVLTDDDSLYVIKGKKLKKVADDVKNFRMSVSGKGLVYCNEDDTLFLYTVKSGKTITITDALYSTNFHISPDGKTVVYTVREGDGADTMLFMGKKTAKLTTGDITVLGLSNGGRHIYAIGENDGDTVLYSYNKKGEKRKLGNIDSETVRFNAEHTQVLFTNNGKTYISNKAKDSEKAASDNLRMVLPPNCQSITSGSATTYPVTSLYDHVYCGEDAWLIQKNANKNVKLASDVSACTLDASGKYLYYIKDYEELQVLQVSKGEKAADKAVSLAEDISNFVVTSDRKLVYYISDAGLYSINGIKGGSSREIASSDVDPYFLYLNAKDVVYYIMDEDAYACSNGKKGTRVVTDAIAITGTPNGSVLILTEDQLYGTMTRKKPKKLAEIDF